MHWTSLPLVVTSLSMAMPYFAAVETGNVITAVCWGVLTTTSTLLHLTKRPFHVYGYNNTIPWLFIADFLALKACAARAVVDGFVAGPMGLLMTSIVLSYASIIFYGGQLFKKFVHDSKNPDIAIVTHMSVHLIAALGSTGLVYLRAFKNGQQLS